jgi:hypothetical protein
MHVKFQPVNKIIAGIVSVMCLIGSIGSAANASDQAATTSRLDFSVTNVKIVVKEVTANEVRVNVNNNGRHVEAVIKKDAQVVTSTFYLDNKLIQVDKRGLQEANVLGATVKKNASAMQRGETGNTTGGAQIQGRIDDIPPGDYRFDTVVYSPRAQYQPYTHPDKNYYGISPYSTWSMSGRQDTHIQLNQYNSNSIINMPAWAVGGGLGAAVGGLVSGNLAGSVIGAIIGGALGAYFGGQATRILDENGCIWFVVDAHPPLVNQGSRLHPIWYMRVRYIALGPFSTTNYDFLIPHP